jgi:hypothetical protein
MSGLTSFIRHTDSSFALRTLAHTSFHNAAYALCMECHRNVNFLIWNPFRTKTNTCERKWTKATPPSQFALISLLVCILYNTALFSIVYACFYRSRESSASTGTGYGLDGRGSLPGRRMIFLFSIASRPALGPIQPPMQCVQRAISRGLKPNTYFYLVSRPRIAELHLHSPSLLCSVYIGRFPGEWSRTHTSI